MKKHKITKRFLKNASVVLVIAFVALTTFFSLSSIVLQEKTLSSYNTNIASNSTKAIFRDDTGNIESMLSQQEIDYTKLGNNIYIANYSDSVDMGDVLYKQYKEEKGITVNRDYAFKVAGNAQKVLYSPETTDVLPEGMSVRDYANSTGKKIVAVIDTGVNDYAIDSYDFTNSSAEDVNGHGTMVAAQIIESSDNNALIVSLKAMDDHGNGYVSTIIQALNKAMELQVDIINMSISAPDLGGTEIFKEVVQKVIDSGITIVAAAGNNSGSSINYIPSNIEGVISVGAMYQGENGEYYRRTSSNFNVDYYAEAGTTSVASAIIAGKLANNNDLSEEITEETITTIKGSPADVAKDEEKLPIMQLLGEETFTYSDQSVEQIVSYGITISNSVLSEIYSIKNGISFISVSQEVDQYIPDYIAKIYDAKTSFYHYVFDNEETAFNSLAVIDSIDSIPMPYITYIPALFSTATTVASGEVGVLTQHASGSTTQGWGDGKSYNGTSQLKTYQIRINATGGNGSVSWSVDDIFYYDGSYTKDGLRAFDKSYPLIVKVGSSVKYNQNVAVQSYFAKWTRLASDSFSAVGSTTVTATLDTSSNDSFSDAQAKGEKYCDSACMWYWFNASSISASVTVDAGGSSTVSIDAGVGTFNGVQKTTVTQQINSTLTVNAKAPRYTVTFDSDGGTSCESMYSSPTLSSWTLGGGGSFNQTTKVFTFGRSDSTLTAKWSNNSITLPTPTKTGYTFKGWTSNGTDTLTGSYTVSGSVTLTAKWQINTYTVTFMDGHSNTTLKTQPVEYNKDATPPANPSRTGYTFAGWSGSYTKVTENRTITATWTANKYTVVFNNNSPRHVSHGTSTDASAETTQRPSGSMSNQSFTYDTGQRLTGLGYSWEGHTFLGWSTNKNASSATYANTSEVKNLTAEDGGTVTLYAIWRADAYSLTVNANAPNGSWDGKDTSTPNNSAGQSPVWGDTISLGKATPADRTVTITYDKNGDGATVSKARDTSKWIFDKWILNDGHKGIIFNNGESNCHYVVQNSNDTVTATYYYATIELADASRPGYTFMGWYYDAECTRKAMGRDGSNGNARSIFRPTESVTLYARWEKTTFNFDETVSAYMQDGTTGDRGVYVRKVDGRDLTPITTTASGSSAVIGIYRGSVASGNLVLKLDTKTGILNSAGAVLISSANADSNGFYNITSYLTAGNTYIMREIEIPDGYEGADDIPFYYDGSKRIQISMKDKPLGEDPTPWSYSLKATKVNPDGDLVAGAKFTLKNETTGKVMRTFTTGTDGVICEDFADYLRGGHRYSLSETSAPEGYQIAAPIYFNAPTSEADYAALPDFTVVDQYKRFNLVVRKENSDKQPLQGATFQIFMKDADGDLEPVYMNENTRSYVKDKNEPNAVKAILTTGADGTIVLKNLPLRANYTGSEADFTKSYYIKEVASPAGYNPLPEIMEILVPDNGNTTFTYTATDESIILTLETGGFGTKLFMFSGCSTVSLAIVASLLRRRRRKAV